MQTCTVPVSEFPQLRYHMRDADDLFQPIAFGFVTERMCGEILAEREHILRHTPATLRPRQLKLLAGYDPRRSAEHFRSLLRPFVGERCERHAA